MKIMITGCGGFLGSRCAAVLDQKGHEVMKITRDVCDITNESELYSTFSAFKPDIVIHSAAISDIGECEKNHELAYKVNFEATENISKLSKDCKLIFISTDQVYNPNFCKPLFETTAVDPQNYYGKTKVMAEDCVRKNVKNSFCYRLTWQFSVPNESGFNKSFGVLQVAQNAINENKPIYASLKSKRYMTWCYDTIDIIKKAVEDELFAGTYNIASPNNMSDYDSYVYVFGQLGASKEQIKRLVLENKNQQPRMLTAYPQNLEKAGIILPDFCSAVKTCINRNEL